jgi:hypothetical protein
LSSLITEALRLTQEYDLAVFPVASDKRPRIKGWRTEATRDPDRIRKLFSLPGAAGIGVPCGPDNDIICFDLDYGHTEDPDRHARLAQWEQELLGAIPRDAVMIRKTRSGGKHILAAWPKTKPPRRIMPKLDVIIEGFYFVWWMNDGGYSHVEGELTDWAPGPGALEVVERDTLGSGSALMTIEDAHTALWSDGDSGQRHDALLRLAHDWVQEHPGQTREQMCAGLEAWARDIYGDRIDPDRLDQLLEWRKGDEPGGELWRAFERPFRQRTVSDEDLARVAAKIKGPRVTQLMSAAAQVQVHEQATSEFETIMMPELMQEDLPDIEWVIEDLIPRANMVGIAGPSGAGKTRWIAALAVCLAAGRTDLLGMAMAPPARVLYIANEERTIDVKRRLKAFAALNGIVGDLPITVRGKEHGQLRLVSDGAIHEATVEKVVAATDAANADFVVFDPFVTLGAEEENAAAGVGMVIEALQTVTNRTRAAVGFAHHTPKGDRGAPEDEWRGDPGAFRGSGAIYSPLDIAVTISPYLPPACHAKGQDGAAARRALKSAQRNKRVAKYVVLDSAKERESQGFAPVIYRLEGQEVRDGGKPIGALRRVSEAEARAECEMGVFALGDEIEEAKHMAWAAVMLDAYPTMGRHDVTIKDVVAVLDAAQPAGWKVRKGTPRAGEGSGKEAVDTLGKSIKIGNVWCYLVHGPGHTQWVVDDV